MTFLDNTIFVLYMAGVMAVGVYHYRQNKNLDDYYVGSRSLGWSHVGMSVVATDVGGGFSIGLGGLGFAMGLSGSWMLFTGLLGAWLASVFLIPKIKSNPAFKDFLTFPEVFKYYYGARVALIAGSAELAATALARHDVVVVIIRAGADIEVHISIITGIIGKFIEVEKLVRHVEA